MNTKTERGENAGTGSPGVPVWLMDRVEFDTNGGCWLWTGSVTRDGYGQLYVNGGTVGAHRASYRLHVGEPGAKQVCHTCDVRCCVNPGHMFLGTRDENLADMRAKGRAAIAPGEQNIRSKLTESQVREIRTTWQPGRGRVANPRGTNALALKYGLSTGTVSDIIHGRRWAHIV